MKEALERVWNLTPMQWATVARSSIAPEGGYYIQQWVTEWPGRMDKAKWRQAWESIGTRHEILRSGFVWQKDQQLSQWFASPEEIRSKLEISEVEIHANDAGARLRELDELLRRDRQRGIDFGHPPLWRLILIAWSDGTTTSVWTFHHALLDGRSHTRVWREACELYESLRTGKPFRLEADNSFRFSEFLQWLGRWSKDNSAAREYWQNRLEGFTESVGLPTLSLDLDSGSYPGPASALNRLIPEQAVSKLRAGASRFGVTLNTLVQAAWSLALARYNGVEDVVIGTTRACRHWTHDRPDEQVGLFINTVPFRCHAAPNKAVGAFLGELRAQQVALRVGEFASADQIRSWCGISNSAALLRTVLMFENEDPTPPSFERTQRGRLIEKTDVLTLAAVAGRELSLTIDFSPQRHSVEQVRRVLEHLEQLLTNLASSPESSPLAEIRMQTPAERLLVLDSWQGARVTSFARPLASILEDQASRHSALPAVEFGGRTWSYAEVNQRANCLARRLLDAVPGESRIAVFLDRSVDQVTTWLAILKAGLTYAPLDPATPADRLRFCLQDLQPKLIITHRSLQSQLPDGLGDVPLLVLDDPAEQRTQDAISGANLGLVADPATASSLLYTSGSTGVPKAAINGFGGLYNFAAELRRRFDLRPGDRVLMSSSTSFDASLFDLVATLQSGATLVLVPAVELRAGTELQQALERHRITATLLTPSVMRPTPPPSSALRIVISAGEPLTADLAARWGKGRRLFNVCGPTECSVWTHCEEVTTASERPTIGRLIPNCRAYVLDPSQEHTPIGVPGELYLSGAAVGLGYWNRPEMTAERFLPDPFSPTPGQRMYRTGDRVRWLSDGRLEYLGRFDHQVKIQGVRVELGEIESALRSHPAVSEAAVALVEQRPVAWLIAQGEPPSPTSLRSWLSLRIPLIFEPARYHFIAELPKTRTGKVDLGRLVSGIVAQHVDSSPENGAAASPGSRPITAEERHQLLVEWNQTARPYPLERSVVQLIEAQAAESPGAIALQHGQVQVTFGDLNVQSNRIANRLLEQGLKPSEVVAVRFHRCPQFIIAALGVMKAGGAYMPVESEAPQSRQNWLLEDAGARFALTLPDHRDRFSDWTGTVATVEEWSRPSEPNRDSNPSVSADPTRLAYVIYTSGSTGTPKGVEVEHRSLSNLIFFYHERLGYGPSDRVTLIANPVFDASVGDIWPGLCAGARVLIPDPNVMQDPDRFIAWLAEGGATYSFAPTALGELILSRPWPGKMALRNLTIGGDTLHCFPPAGLSFHVLNTYGPTENTVDSVWTVIESKPDGGAPPIGRPIFNVFAYVLDEQQQLVPPGVAGELYLGGEQVARGYRNRPDLTAAAFFPDPFTDRPGARMYRTGDRVRWNSDGELEFIGRNDDQIQVRGKRVELGEIEFILRQHPEVREVCCRPQRDGNAVSGVVAHVVLKSESNPSETTGQIHSSIHQFAAERLPAYMVPSRILIHSELPMTPQGKVDRQALSRLQSTAGPATQEPVPEDSLERALTRLWHRILPQTAGLSGDRSFFELGGDSLLAVKLLIGVYEITGRRLPLSTFLLNPTLSGLCRFASDAELESKMPVLALRSNPGSVHPPIFCMHELFGDVNAYFDLAEILGDEFTIYGVRSPALNDLSRVPESIESAAAQVHAWIRQMYPTGPFLLLGYSWGGLLAFEVARQCVRKEGFAPFCALIGTQAPPRNPSLAERVFHAIRAVPPWLHHFFRDRGQRLRRILSAGAFVRRLKKNLTSDVPVELAEWATSPLARTHVDLMVRYRPEADISVPLHLFREKESFHWKIHPSEYWWTDHEHDGGWHRWARCSPEVTWMEAHHENVMKAPQVAPVAAALREKLAQHIQSTPGGAR